MLIRNKKYFGFGLGLAVSFILVFIYMFTPTFGEGRNAFEAADRLFNSISKGSVDFSSDLSEKSRKLAGVAVDIDFSLFSDEMEQFGRKVLSANSLTTGGTEPNQQAVIPLDVMVDAALRDCSLMFNNEEKVLQDKYGLGGRQVLYTWWNLLHGVDLHLKGKKLFSEAAIVHEIKVKGVEVAYNFFGIGSAEVRTQVWKLFASLLFYVIYTMWWGYAIFFMFEGVGLSMTSGAKAEI